MSNHRILLGRTFAMLAGLLMLGLVGCVDFRTADLKTEYGQVSKEPTSINGLSILAEKVKQRGASVTVRRKISPMIDRFNTVFWFPKDRSCPSESAVTALQEWLEFDPNRTLVFVGGNYDAKSDYLRQVYQATPVSEREELLRQLAEKKSAVRFENNPFGYWVVPETESDWFSVKLQPGLISDELAGPLVDRISGPWTPPELPFEFLLEPTDQPFGGYSESEITSLLEVKGEPFVWKAEDDSYWHGRLIVVSNASFLVNFSMVDSSRERLANELLNEVEPLGEVLFLESGPQPITVSDSDYENHNSWAWIAERPLRYIVPHFLFWGILFCFVFFPIFGRPRKTQRQSTTSFRHHINAIAKQMERSGQYRQAQERVARFQEQSGDRSAHRESG